jgi:hypothetical protein
MSETFTDIVDVVRPDQPVILARSVPGSAAGGPGGGLFPTVRVIRLNADTGEVIIGGSGTPGTLRIVDGNLRERAILDATFGNLRLGGNGTDGDILVYPTSGDPRNNGDATIHLDGEAGDILLRNGDCAEEFDVEAPESVTQGSVLSLAENGRLRVAREPYDRKVVGIVSGAGDTRPGIILARDPRNRNRLPVALVGRVNCWVDATYGAVAVGDLLTSSATPGHAMRAADPARAFGSVIGKAMRALSTGSGLVPVLVALQ